MLRLSQNATDKRGQTTMDKTHYTDGSPEGRALIEATNRAEKRLANDAFPDDVTQSLAVAVGAGLIVRNTFRGLDTVTEEEFKERMNLGMSALASSYMELLAMLDAKAGTCDCPNCRTTH